MKINSNDEKLLVSFKQKYNSLINTCKYFICKVHGFRCSIQLNLHTNCLCCWHNNKGHHCAEPMKILITFIKGISKTGLTCLPNLTVSACLMVTNGQPLFTSRIATRSHQGKCTCLWKPALDLPTHMITLLWSTNNAGMVFLFFEDINIKQ